jgi:hypothetical protein
MFFIVVILIFVLFSIKKHNIQMARHKTVQEKYIDHLEQYIHNVTKEMENKSHNPVIETHRFMDMYEPIRA